MSDAASLAALLDALAASVVEAPDAEIVAEAGDWQHEGSAADQARAVIERALAGAGAGAGPWPTEPAEPPAQRPRPWQH